MDYDYLVDGLGKDDLVIDVGGGDGRIMDLLDCQTVTVDVQFPSTDAETEYVRGDGCSLPFETSTADYVLCNQVLEHIQDTDGVVKEIARVLKPNGEALVTFPNRLAPTQPHLPPRWYSYLPRSLGLKLAPHVLDESTADYYRNHEFMLSPWKARPILSRHFDTVEYRTFKSKTLYRDNHLSRINAGAFLRLIYVLSPMLSVIESSRGVGWLIELFYSNCVYHCRV